MCRGVCRGTYITAKIFTVYITDLHSSVRVMSWLTVSDLSHRTDSKRGSRGSSSLESGRLLISACKVCLFTAVARKLCCLFYQKNQKQRSSLISQITSLGRSRTCRRADDRTNARTSGAVTVYSTTSCFHFDPLPFRTLCKKLSCTVKASCSYSSHPHLKLDLEVRSHQFVSLITAFLIA